MIADAEAERLLENKELAELIAGCIKELPERRLNALKWLLNQQEIERPDLEKERRLLN